MRTLLLVLSFSLAAGCAAAFDAPSDAAPALARGEAWLQITPDGPDVAGRVRAAEDVDGSPAQVFALMTDCARAPRLAPGLRSCRILERDPAGRWDVREHVTRPVMFFPKVVSVFRSDYDPPRGFSYRRLGGDMKVLEGSWRLIPLDGGTRTRVVYDGRAALPHPVPRVLARMVLRQQAVLALAALKRECLARADGDATAGE